MEPAARHRGIRPAGPWNVTAAGELRRGDFEPGRRFVGGQRQPADPPVPLSRRQHQRSGDDDAGADGAGDSLGVRLVLRQRWSGWLAAERRADDSRRDAADRRRAVVAERVGIRQRRLTRCGRPRVAARRPAGPPLRRLLHAAGRHDDGPCRIRPAASFDLALDHERARRSAVARLRRGDVHRHLSLRADARHRRQLHAVESLGELRRRERGQRPVPFDYRYPEYKQASWNFPRATSPSISAIARGCGPTTIRASCPA